jgi:arylsulfatase A-like enzyme/Tfp pilus assembly protein PilF
MGRRKRKAAGPAAPTAVAAAEKPRTARRLLAAGVVLALAAGVTLWLRSRPPRVSLLLFTLDTLRADHVGAYGHAGASTPALDGLAARGVRFASAQSAVPLTGPSHATIFTGVYPPEHGVRDNVAFPLGTRRPTLAALLKQRGYRTAAFVAAYPVARGFGFGQGFDEYSERFHEIPIPGQGAERPGNEVADEVVAWLGKQPAGPFFLWAHFYDPHAPYTPPEPYRERFAGRLYDGEIAFADAQVARILEALRAAGREDDTLVVAMADHGESLGEHSEQTHAILIYEASLRIPLILAGPGVPSGRVLEERVGTVDVLPTLLGLLGVSSPSGLEGRDLREAFDAPLPAAPLYAESLFGRLNCRWASLRAVTHEGWKLIEGAGSELYDLAQDPGETRDRAAEEPERVARLRRLLSSAMARMAPEGDSARPAALSPEQEQKLRSLGYVSGSGGGGALDQPGLPDPRTHVRLYERVQSAAQARGPSVERAIAELVRIADEDPGNPYAHFTLANVAYRHGRLALAERAYTRTLELEPDRPGMRLSFGRLLRDLGKLAESEKHLRIAAEQTTPDDVRTPASLAETLVALGKLEEAEAIVAAALQREPNHVDVLHARGLLLVAQGRRAEGIPFLERAAEGRDPEPWIEIARVRLDEGEPAAALAAVRQALTRSPGHPWALAVEGRALVLAGQRAEGLAALRRALELKPRRPEVWRELARAFEAAGEAEVAARCLRQAEEVARG